MKFVTTYVKGSKYLLKIDFGSNPDGEWATTDEKVFNFAKTTFKSGDECNCEFEERNGQKHITRIYKGGATQTKAKKEEKPYTPPSDDGKKHCACGAEIKNPRYSQCFACNKQKKENPPVAQPTSAPEQQKTNYYPGDYLKPHHPEAVERMTKLSVLQSASQAVGAMVGMLNNADIVAETVIAIYHKLLEEVKN
jgi:hypothetical protein